jgi:dipeptidase
MKRLYLILIAACLAGLLRGQSTIADLNCSTVIVGKDASATGYVMVAHNEDDGGNQIVNFYKFPGRDNKKGETVRFKEGATEAQASHSYSYLWLEMPGMDFSDTYMNENGVLVTSNSCPSREQFGEITDGGIGYELRRLIAERSLSARVAVEMAGQLVEKWGYCGSGRTYTIADKNEAWLFAVVRGKQWVARRVPDDQVAFIPNYYTIREIDLTDNENFLASKDLITYAQRRGWYDPEKDGVFDFSQVYSHAENFKSMGNIGRMWIGVGKLSGREYKMEDKFPCTFIPQHKITMKDIISVLENHFEGTDLDDSQDYKKGTPHFNKIHCICSSSQQFSFIAEMRSGLPWDIGGRIWIAPRRGCVNPYIPFYFGLTEVPASLTMDTPDKAYELHFRRPPAIYDRSQPLAWWTFVAMTDYADQNYGERISGLRRNKEDLDRYYNKLANQLEKDYMPIYKKQPAKAVEMINTFEKEVLSKTLTEANRLLGK